MSSEDAASGSASDASAVKSNIASACPELKRAYEACFTRWYLEEFQKSGDAEVSLPCPELFQRYRDCVQGKIVDKGFVMQEVEDMNFLQPEDFTTTRRARAGAKKS